MQSNFVENQRRNQERNLLVKHTCICYGINILGDSSYSKRLLHRIINRIVRTCYYSLAFYISLYFVSVSFSVGLGVCVFCEWFIYFKTINTIKNALPSNRIFLPLLHLFYFLLFLVPFSFISLMTREQFLCLLVQFFI